MKLTKLRKAGMITVIGIMGTVDALVISPVIRPIVQVVKTGINITKVTKTDSYDEAEEVVADTATDCVL